jgi:polyhydroxybutyrate depolymerase
MKKAFCIIILLAVIFSTGSTTIINKTEPSSDNSSLSRHGELFRIMFHKFRIRSYRIHIPESYTGEQPVPLIIALHGGGGRAKSMLSKTNMNEKSDEEGFIALYPNGICRLLPLRTWNVGFCCGLALKRNVDDVRFIKTLIQKMMIQYNINESRIFVTGHSNGGMLAYRLASELSESIAAIAPVAASIGGYETDDSDLWMISQPEYPVSVLSIHGKLDENVPYDGGRGNNTGGSRSFLSVNESISFWVNTNNCTSEPVTTILENATIDLYEKGNNSTVVMLYSIENSGHSWPGSPHDPIQEFSATDIIWDFFKNNPKQ